MRVLLVDDNPLFLEGLRNMLEASEIEVVGTAGNAQEAIAQATHLRPEIVLMDVQMPGGSGIEATRALKSRFPQMKIVMLTVSESEEHLFDAIAAGASGYLVKGSLVDGFVAALEGMARGESPLSPGLAVKILAEFARRAREREAARPATPPPDPLSGRQTEILRMVASGRRYKEVAGAMGLSEATIKYHMGEITDRLHLENRAQAIAFVSRTTPKLGFYNG